MTTAFLGLLLEPKRGSRWVHISELYVDIDIDRYLNLTLSELYISDFCPTQTNLILQKIDTSNYELGWTIKKVQRPRKDRKKIYRWRPCTRLVGLQQWLYSMYYAVLLLCSYLLLDTCYTVTCILVMQLLCYTVTLLCSNCQKVIVVGGQSCYWLEICQGRQL